MTALGVIGPQTNPIDIPEKSSHVGEADLAMRETIRVSLIRRVEDPPYAAHA
jgi:hypothetical protein